MTPSQERLELTNPQAYVTKLQDLVGKRDHLEVLTETPDALAKIVNDTSTETMRTRPFANKWTPNEVLGHLVDTEWVFGYRTRTIACDDEPSIFGIDQEKWVDVQRHNEAHPTDLLKTFQTLRAFNLRFWKTLTPDQLQRNCQHNERGPESLSVLMNIIPGHDLSHLDQIRRYLQAIYS